MEPVLAIKVSRPGAFYLADAMTMSIRDHWLPRYTTNDILRAVAVRHGPGHRVRTGAQRGSDPSIAVAPSAAYRELNSIKRRASREHPRARHIT